MSDEARPSQIAGNPEEQPAGTGRGPAWRSRRIVTAVIVVCLVGGGVGAAVAESGGPSSSSTPAAAVHRLLEAADHRDLLGAIEAIAPGERTAIEPGLVGLVHQLERLKVLASSTNFRDLGGMSLHFTGVRTTTTMLSPTLAAVAITGGSVTGSLNVNQLPIGSFVRGLTHGMLPQKAETSTSAISTGRGAIVTEQVGGTWYVSLGYTIAYDALRSEGRPAVTPAVNGAVPAAGSATPTEAVAALLRDAAAFNLRQLIGDLPPGEMGALQSYASLFLGRAETALAKDRSEARVRITNLGLTSSPVDGGVLVKVRDLGLSVTYDGITIAYRGGCVSYGYQGRSVRRCPSRAASSAEIRKIIAAFPSSLRPLATRLTKDRPAIGFVAVQENGRWYVSPVATLLNDLNGYLSLLQPGDLTAIASLAERPAEAKALGHALEQAVLGALASGSA